MSQNPYENEPGYEAARKEEPNPAAYVAKIRHETLRIAVVQRLEGLLGMERGQPASKRQRTEGAFSTLFGKDSKPHSPPGDTGPADGDAASEAVTPATEPSVYEYDAEATFNAFESHWDPFADLMKRRFLWYYDTYVATVKEQAKEQSLGKAFTRMEFEYPPNSMDGQFDYKSLLSRLERIKKALDDEQEEWVTWRAKLQVRNESQLAVQLAFQFKQLHEHWKKSNLNLLLPEPPNPFKWTLTLLGKPLTNLDGGIFIMQLYIPPNFPTVQPRVVIDSPIFHHRVSTSGVLCYYPKKEDEIGSHLEAIVDAIECEDPKFDPRAVLNPEAFGLYWGGDEKRKLYNRKLRRSAQESSEF